MKVSEYKILIGKSRLQEIIGSYYLLAEYVWINLLKLLMMGRYERATRYYLALKCKKKLLCTETWIFQYSLT